MYDNYPIEKLCYCDKIADRYNKKSFVSKAGFKVVRVYYKCRNCKSRIHDDFCPELDSMKVVNVLDLLK